MMLDEIRQARPRTIVASGGGRYSNFSILNKTTRSRITISICRRLVEGFLHCQQPSAWTIPPPLRDRMEVIQLAGYSDREKLQIAKRYLVPRQVRENGVTAEQLEFEDEAIYLIATRYTREAGVRQLEAEHRSRCAQGRVEDRQGRNGKDCR
jgi:hypothetical protein